MVCKAQLRKLDDDTETAKSAGVSPTSEVRVLFTSMTRECTSRKEAGCDVSDLLDVSIPDNVTVIGSGAFESSGSLIRVTHQSSNILRLRRPHFCSYCSSILFPTGVLTVPCLFNLGTSMFLQSSADFVVGFFAFR